MSQPVTGSYFCNLLLTTPPFASPGSSPEASSLAGVNTMWSEQRVRASIGFPLIAPNAGPLEGPDGHLGCYWEGAPKPSLTIYATSCNLENIWKLSI